MAGASQPPRPPPAVVPARPGERYVDASAFDDVGADESFIDGLRRGVRVLHARYGEGEVRSVEQAADVKVVVYFPGWGEKKILARFLQGAS